MKLSPLYNARNNNATKDVNVSASGRGHHGSRNKSNQGRGGLNTKYSPPKIASQLQHYEILRLRGGAIADMDIADEAELYPVPPPITVLKHVVSSVSEAEFGALFVNAKEGTVTHTTLAEMGHNQDATELKTDNTTADGIINNTVKQKRSKAMDMIFYWVKDRVEQDQIIVGWAQGDTNMGHYFTKHHSPAHHKRMRPYHLHDKHSPMIRHDTRLAILRGCVDISPSSQPNQALSTLNYGLTPTCNLSQSHHGHTPIACAHTTGNSYTHLSQVSYRNLLRYHYKQGCNQCEHSYTQVCQHLNDHQLHLNAPYKHLSVSVSTSPVERTN
jgi:hypothetical protein